MCWTVRAHTHKYRKAVTKKRFRGKNITGKSQCPGAISHSNTSHVIQLMDIYFCWYFFIHSELDFSTLVLLCISLFKLGSWCNSLVGTCPSYITKSTSFARTICDLGFLSRSWLLFSWNALAQWLVYLSNWNHLFFFSTLINRFNSCL